MKKYLKYIISVSISLFVILIDLLSKIIVVNTLEYGKPIKILGEFLMLDLCFNEGAAFSILENAPSFILPLLSLLMSVAIGFMIYKFGDFKKKPIGTIALSLMLGGALGNMVDRIFNFPACLYTFSDGSVANGVVDFMNTNHIFELLSKGKLTFGIWNLADACLVIGTIAFIIHILFF